MIKDIQILRCIAILFIIGLHSSLIVPSAYMHVYNYIERVFHTNTGVELFFVIAGYFLAHSLYKINTKESRSIQITQVFTLLIKKVKRLSPSTYFWVSVPLVMSLFFYNPDIWYTPHQMLQKVLLTFVWMTDFEMPGRPGALYGYFWAVALEMQFFIIFPFVYVFLGKNKTLLLSLIVCIIMTFYRPGASPYWWWTRFDPMLYGVLCYSLINDFIEKETLKKELTSGIIGKVIVSLVLIAALAATYNALVKLPFFKSSAASLVSSVMLILALSANGYFSYFGKYFNSLLIWIGDRSFALYCCHIPSWMIVRQVFETLKIQTPYMFFFQIVFMFICSDFTLRYIEPVFTKKTKPL